MECTRYEILIMKELILMVEFLIERLRKETFDMLMKNAARMIQQYKTHEIAWKPAVGDWVLLPIDFKAGIKIKSNRDLKFIDGRDTPHSKKKTYKKSEFHPFKILNMLSISTTLQQN